MSASKVGRRGTYVIPADLRKRYGLGEGAMVVAEPTAEGILLRPAAVVPVEIYSRERQAEFLLSNAVDTEDFQKASEEVRRLGLDPSKVRHESPSGA
ncbi:MAG: AbrB/MazE/SpoVT family DNA-binding domain-containing protein [Planctomycetes bacterium]|nr:AbrB/MazE/SpoVT family DNA-binding domain-containing protein [Planctomycetota bacterium]